MKSGFSIVFVVFVLFSVLSAANGQTKPLADGNDIIISEVMVLGHVDDPFGPEWIELFNQGDKPVNLQGLVIQTDSGGFHVISVSNALVLKSGDYQVLQVQESPSDTKPGYYLGQDFNMDTNEDTIRLFRADTLLSSFTYGKTLTPKSGVSFNREPVKESNPWCYSRSRIEKSLDLGTPGQPNTFCDNDGDSFAEDQGDCNDSNSKINPNANEICNGLDDNCDGKIDEGVETTMVCKSLGVCKGTKPKCMGTAGFVCIYPTTYESVESTCDGLDNDCDGLTDNGLGTAGHCLSKGECKGTTAICTGTGGWYCPYPSTYESDESTCDGLDNDCDGLTDEIFSYQGKAVGAACSGTGICGNGEVTCSVDGDRATCSTNPGGPKSQAEKERCDALDNDCDGLTDEGFPVGKTCSVGKGVCKSTGVYLCSDKTSGIVCSASPGPVSEEICNDGLDNDCDGLTDETDCKTPGGGACNSQGTGPVNITWILPFIALILLLVTARNVQD